MAGWDAGLARVRTKDPRKVQRECVCEREGHKIRICTYPCQRRSRREHLQWPFACHQLNRRMRRRLPLPLNCPRVLSWQRKTSQVSHNTGSHVTKDREDSCWSVGKEAEEKREGTGWKAAACSTHSSPLVIRLKAGSVCISLLFSSFYRTRFLVARRRGRQVYRGWELRGRKKQIAQRWSRSDPLLVAVKVNCWKGKTKGQEKEDRSLWGGL